MARPLLKRPAAAGHPLMMLKNTPANPCSSRRQESVRAAPQLMLRNAPEPPTAAKIMTVEVVRGVAVPAAEWRIVPNGVACPRGCEFKMNMTTGTNMIRLLQAAPNIERPVQTALVVAPSRSPAPPKTLLKRKRLQPTSAGQHRASRRCPPEVVVLDDSPSPSRARMETAQVQGGSSSTLRSRGPMSAIAGKVKAIEKQYSRRRTSVRKDGSREEASVAVRSKEIRPKNGSMQRQRTTSRQESGIKQLRDGRKVITETITLQRVTVLPRSPAK